MDVQARAAPAKNRFDQADRDRIRRALLRYMRDNAIGVPTLQKLIAEANDLSLDRVPLKTLQRFLGNTHRTNEAIVRFCDRFAADLDEADPITALGEQAAAFHGVWRNGHDCRPLPPELAGAYTGRAETEAQATEGMRLILDGTAQKTDWVAFSQLDIEQPAGRPFAVAREAVTNWQKKRPASESGTPETEPRRIYEGIILHPNDCLFALLRNTLTGAPRIYWLARFNDHPLAGHGHEALGTLDDSAGVEIHSSARVIFDRLEV